MVCYIAAFLDRVNVGFAKLQMLDDLKFSEAVYGLGAGIFFIGYFLFEVPSNVLMHRIGARKTLARIMILWGLISAAMALTQTPTQFYLLRFLLGAAEAGFYPGIILYLTYWFPSSRRGQIVAVFMTAVPFAGILGGPLSGWVMEAFHQTSGLAGWQWMFIIEAIPSVLLGVAVLWYLDDRIGDARWLSEAEKARLNHNLSSERATRGEHVSLLRLLRDRRVVHMALICYCTVSSLSGLAFWVPSVIRSTGVVSLLDVGLLTAVPNVRGDFHGAGVPPFGRDAGAPLAHDRALPDRRDRPGAEHVVQSQPDAGGGHAVRRGRRLHGVLAAVLEPADRLPGRQERRRGHRRHQFVRRAGGFCQPLCDRLDQGPDRLHRLGHVLPGQFHADRRGAGVSRAQGAGESLVCCFLKDGRGSPIRYFDRNHDDIGCRGVDAGDGAHSQPFRPGKRDGGLDGRGHARGGFDPVTIDRNGSVLGLIGPRDAEVALLFDGHMDVVPVTGSWRSDPFGGEIRDGRLHGRGSTDMKGGIAAAICGVAAAALGPETPRGRVGQRAGKIIEGHALASVLDVCAPQAVVICEPSKLQIKAGQKGRVELLLTFHGKPAHADAACRRQSPACGRQGADRAGNTASAT